MKRRAFLRLFSAGVAGAVALAKLPASLFVAETPTQLFEGPITFRGVPLVYNRDCPQNTVYFMDTQAFIVWTPPKITFHNHRRLGVITNIEPQ